MSGAQVRAGDAAVAVILVNWNGWRHTVECIDSILGQAHGNCHVFVVDNDSADGSVERIAAWCAEPAAAADWQRHDGVDRHSDGAGAAVGCRIARWAGQALPPAPPGCRVSLVHSGGNLGFAGACNVGVGAASLEAFDHFWFLNNDTVIHRDAMAALLRRACRDDRPGMVGSLVRYYARPGVVQALGGARLDLKRGQSRHLGEGLPLAEAPTDAAAVERELDYIFGASMLVSRAFIGEVGPMQEDYFLFFEEVDWALRGRGRFALGYAADSHVFHHSGASSATRELFSTRLYYRNRIRFISRFFPQRLAATRRYMALEILYFLKHRKLRHALLVASVCWQAPRLAAQTPPQPGFV